MDFKDATAQSLGKNSNTITAHGGLACKPGPSAFAHKQTLIDNLRFCHLSVNTYRWLAQLANSELLHHQPGPYILESCSIESNLGDLDVGVAPEEPMRESVPEHES